MEIARVRFRGDTAARAVRAVARAPCVVCLRMYIRHTHRLGPPLVEPVDGRARLSTRLWARVRAPPARGGGPGGAARAPK